MAMIILMGSKENKEKSKRFLGLNNVRFLYLNSNLAAGKIKCPLDFVYIDGNHDYSFVKKDIEDYYSLLKMGGVLAGHDINNFGFENGVLKAVMEFAVNNDLYVYNYHNDWWIVKTDGRRENVRKTYCR